MEAALGQIRACVEQWRAKVGSERIAIVLGTSTSGIDEGIQALAAEEVPAGYHYCQQELGSPALFLADYLGVSGPAYTLSTACSSSARAFISAQRLLAADLVDLVLVMSVNPGFGGQRFLPEVLEKVTTLCRRRAVRGNRFLVEMDGGLGPENVAEVVRGGCQVVVAGSAVFGTPDPAETLRRMRRCAEETDHDGAHGA